MPTKGTASQQNINNVEGKDLIQAMIYEIQGSDEVQGFDKNCCWSACK